MAKVNFKIKDLFFYYDGEVIICFNYYHYKFLVIIMTITKCTVIIFNFYLIINLDFFVKSYYYQNFMFAVIFMY